MKDGHDDITFDINWLAFKMATCNIYVVFNIIKINVPAATLLLCMHVNEELGVDGPGSKTRGKEFSTLRSHI
jgi:hypothetical protein